MNLTQLHYVSAVVRTGSFSQAAEHCFVTQPTLSNGIAQLENELCQRIFSRTTRSVVLTDFGKQILPFIETILNAQSALIEEAKQVNHRSQQRIRIGTSPLIDAEWLRKMLAMFQKKHPDIDIIFHELNMADLYQMLREGSLDIVLGVSDTKKAAWESLFLYEEPLFFVPCGNNMPKTAKKQSVFLHNIVDETYIMVPDVCGLARATRALFRHQRRKLKEYPGKALGYQIVEEWATLGLGAGILPRSKLSKNDHSFFIIRTKSNKDLTLKFEALWLKTAADIPSLIALRDHLQNP